MRPEVPPSPMRVGDENWTEVEVYLNDMPAKGFKHVDVKAGVGTRYKMNSDNEVTVRGDTAQLETVWGKFKLGWKK